MRYLFLSFFLILGCAGPRALNSSSDVSVRPSMDAIQKDTVVQTETIDSIYTDTTPAIDTSVLDSIPEEPDTTIDFSDVIQEIENENHMVRIQLASKKNSITLFSYDRFRVSNQNKRITISPGTVRFTIAGEGVKVEAHGKSAVLYPPFTINALESQKLFSYEKSDYRGEMHILRKETGLALINKLPVESYLRGVVPLEIGRKGKSDSAAVQAQAVAARTYTYKRMSERKKWDYDLLPTVSDQVYGGASAEHAHCDNAIKATEDIVLIFNNQMVDALYHSTCGGHTATKHEVWGGVPFPYLQGKPDVMNNGAPFCGISPLITWKEQWDVTEFSRLINKYSSATPRQEHFNGNVSQVKVESTTSSGRVQSCLVAGASGTARYGGDKIRFVFRRAVPGNGILRSASFTISRNGDTIVAKGRGYGHGIGMCQMGAIGRARSGFSFDEILHFYYSGVTIEDIDEYFRKQQQLVGR